MIPFSVSIAVLSLAQGAVVTVPRALTGGPPARRLARLRSRRWALVPPAAVIGFVLIASLAERASADGLTYLALIAVPVLAALALGWLAWDAGPPRPTRALLTIPLFALAWADRGAVPAEAAALILTALSCAALGAMLAAVTPPRWLAAGIVAMAVADTALVASDLLQKPNNALNAAHPAAGLPQLQSAAFGSAVMGYGDLFVAGVLGALLATAMGRRPQLHGALLTALLALCFDLLFFFVDELPATVPVALTLLALMARQRGLTQTPPPTRREEARSQTRPVEGAGGRGESSRSGSAPAQPPAARARASP
jgi:hypothetical protein